VESCQFFKQSDHNNSYAIVHFQKVKRLAESVADDEPLAENHPEQPEESKEGVIDEDKAEQHIALGKPQEI
jgi:hypothetical protein